MSWYSKCIELAGCHRLDGQRIAVSEFPTVHYVPVLGELKMQVTDLSDPKPKDPDLLQPPILKHAFRRTDRYSNGARVYEFEGEK